ncbi:MAG: hypothetical protein KIH65_002025 [Candidatus Uhrbacteria bacterium]|nr:hypothetical protein [Candidatus Uhrbacteria bacterium]
MQTRQPNQIRKIEPIKNLKQLLQELKEWKHGWWRYLKYSCKLTTWIYIARLRRLYLFWKCHFDIFLRASFILFALGVGLILHLIGGSAFTKDILSDYLISVGAMAGGAIAIVFTISVFLLQSAADLYSSQYFEVYIHDWREKIVYALVILITLLFFGTSLYVGGLEDIPEAVSPYIVWVSLVLVGVIFALIDWQYKTVRQKISPTKAIYFLENQGVKFLDQVHEDARRIADIMTTRDGNLNENEALAKTYNYFFQPRIDDLNRQLENLIEISLKLSDKQEVGTTKRGLWAVHNVLAKYIEVRKTSSVAMPSGTTFLAVESDSQRFLFDNLDRLNKAGEKFIKEDKDVLATYILHVHQKLAEKAKDITYVGMTGNNPILENIVGNLEAYISIGTRAKNLEVAFQGAGSLGDVATHVAEVGLNHTLAGIQDKLKEIAVYGVIEKQTVVIDQCNKNIVKILGLAFTHNKIIAQHQFSSGLKHVSSIALHVFTARQTGFMPNDFSSSSAMTKGYDSLLEPLYVAIQRYTKITNARDKDDYRRNITDFFDELYRSLRTLSEELKHSDDLLSENIGRLLFNVNNIILQLIENKEFGDKRGELSKQLAWNIHLPYWFVRHSEKFDAGSNNFRSLTESVAKTGILAIARLGNKELAKDAVQCLGSITQEALKKNIDKYGYDEPRILGKACYIGILALKMGWFDVYAETVIKIADFQPKYEAKYFNEIPPHVNIEEISPRKDQLRIGIMLWRDDFDYNRLNRMAGLRNDAEDMMYDLINIGDIDWFTYKVWGEWDADSPVTDKIEEDIKNVRNKKNIIQKLVNLLKTRVL